MMFRCGLTYEARLAKRRKAAQDAAARAQQWHRVFLWWPTTIRHDGQHRVCAWLTTVERRYPSAQAENDWLVPNCYEVNYGPAEYRVPA